MKYQLGEKCLRKDTGCKFKNVFQKVIQELNKNTIKLNITAVYSFQQVKNT